MRTCLMAVALFCSACSPAAPLVAAPQPPAPVVAAPTALAETVIPAGSLFDGEPLSLQFWPGQRWTYKAETRGFGADGVGRVTLAITKMDASRATFMLTQRMGEVASSTVEQSFPVGTPGCFSLIAPVPDGDPNSMTTTHERVNVLAGSFDTVKLSYLQKQRNDDGEVVAETKVEQWGSKEMGLVRYSATTRVPGAGEAAVQRYVVELESFKLGG